MRLHQEISIGATPEAIYTSLLSSKQFSAFSNADAEIDPQEGGQFTCFGGQIRGRQIELKPNSLIVQAWRAASWQTGVYSIVRFTLNDEGNGTRLILDHTGYPEEAESHMERGWQKMYWQPMQEFFQ